MISVCQLVLQDRVSSSYSVIKGSCIFMVKNPSKYDTILSSLVVIGTVVVEINVFT